MSSIQEHTVVSLHYTLRDEHGEVLDRSESDDPLLYLHGMGQIVSGLENALCGHQVGDKLNVTVPPSEGYGEVEPDMLVSVARSQFDGDEVKVGMQLAADLGNGQYHVFWVSNVDEENVELDGNHPLAGQTLFFEVEVMGIRDATLEEIAHGHAHGEGGHHHH